MLKPELWKGWRQKEALMVSYLLTLLRLKPDRRAFTPLEYALIGGALAVAIFGLFDVYRQGDLAMPSAFGFLF
jgi:hypothetical protein